MHEMGLAQAILETALHISGGRPVTGVVVSAGEGQSVSADSLQFSFGLVADGTAAAGASLAIRTVAGDRLLVDEVAVGGDPPEVLRRVDLEVVEPPHEHDHDPADHPVHPAWL